MTIEKCSQMPIFFSDFSATQTPHPCQFLPEEKLPAENNFCINRSMDVSANTNKSSI
jgi:hypothetical protein